MVRDNKFLWTSRYNNLITQIIDSNNNDNLIDACQQLDVSGKYQRQLWFLFQLFG